MSTAKLTKLLKSNRVEGFNTHVSLVNPKGKFFFNRQTLEDFYNKYNDARKETDEDGNSISIGLAEKSQDYLPILADIDLKEPLTNVGLTTLYTIDFVKQTIKIYQTVLSEIIDGLSPQELTCVFLAKEPYSVNSGGDSFIKHGFHLHFPYIFLSKNSQENHLIPQVKTMVKETFNLENIIDKGYLSAPWLMYGSQKEGAIHKPYLVKYIFNSKLKKISLENAFSEYKIYDNSEHEIDIEGKVEDYLPRILSISPYGRPIKEVKPSLVKFNQQKLEEINTKKERSDRLDFDSIDKTLETAKLLLNMISEVRCSIRDDWIKIAWILHSTFEGSLEARDLWKEWAENCPEKYIEEEHDDFWDRIQVRSDGLSMGTLRYYASIDSPAEYKKFKLSKGKKFLLKALDGSHLDLSRAFHSIEGEYIKIVDEDVCYIWNSQKLLWIHHKCSRLLSIISDTLTPKYLQYCTELYSDKTKFNLSGDTTHDVEIDCKIKDIYKVNTSLKNASFLKATLNLYISEFRDDEIECKMNSEKYITPIKHGKVIDLRTSEIRTRDNTDLFSFECPVQIVRDTSIATKFLDSLSNGALDHTLYLTRLCGYFMTGDVSHRGFYISWGVGRNGKSSLVNILKEIMGKFFVSISEDVFIKKDKTSNATPELMPLIGARFAVLSETDEKEKLNSKRIKSLTGSDTISARALYKDQINFVPHCKIMMLTNVKPEFDADDQALIDRLNFIPFPARFNKNRENTKYIESLTTHYLDQFFTLFCQGAKSWFEEGEMMDSQISIDGKIKYQKENDTLRDFINSNTVEEKGHSIPSKDLFNAYKNYCSDNDIRPITVQKFTARVENEFYTKDNIKKVTMFMNCRFINGSDDQSLPNPLL